MRKKKERKIGILCASCLLLSTAALSGCAKEGDGQDETVPYDETDSGGDVETEVALETLEEETDMPEQDSETNANAKPEEEPEIMPFTEEDLLTMQYMEKIMLEDYYGDMSEYDAYAPKGTSTEDGFTFYYEHGLMYSAEVCNFGDTEIVYEYLGMVMDGTMEDWQREGSEYTDAQLSEVMENGDDRYQIATAKGMDYYGTPFEIKKICYADIKQEGIGVVWELEISENHVDSETEAIIDEMGRCYQVSLDGIKTGGDWIAGDMERAEKQQDVYEPKEGDNVVEKVEGYQYMGLAELKLDDADVECQVMIPMGTFTYAQDDNVHASMHGVAVSGNFDMLLQKNFLATVKSVSDSRYKYRADDEERNRNVWKSEMIEMSGFDEAFYVIVAYEAKDYVTQEYAPQVDVLCFMRTHEEYCLEYFITLAYDEYDNSTNTVIKELETAYGLDLEEYYNNQL